MGIRPPKGVILYGPPGTGNNNLCLSFSMRNVPSFVDYKILSSVILIWFDFCAGKTLLAKAVANQTSATFLRVVGSELIQKYLVSLTMDLCFHQLELFFKQLFLVNRVTVQNWFENSFVSPKNTHRPSCLSTKSMLSAQKG